MTTTLRHPLLGLVRGQKLASWNLVQYSGLPYARVTQRFGRSTTLQRLPSTDIEKPFEATRPGPECIQPENATKLDAECGQFPHDDFEEQPQSENCLYLNITTPATDLEHAALPVVVFLHGGAFFLGSSTRPYYSPFNFVSHALHADRPIIFVSINYRLGALGFLHSPKAQAQLPANNGLHDQLRAFEWIHRHISGFGGDPKRITAMGQSAGAESLSLHTISSNPTPLFKQLIAFSGSPVTMPCKTPGEHQSNFISLAKKLGITDVEHKTSETLAQAFIDAPISEIRDLSFVGAPCSSSEILPYDDPTMALTSSKPSSNVHWLERTIFSSATFDGGVSYNILFKSKHENAKTFIQNVHENMSSRGATELLSLYDITEADNDADALRKICQFESDIGFFFGSLAQVQGSSAPRKYLQIFDMKNPFDDGGSLPKDKFATHTWDIVGLLGKYDDRLEARKSDLIKSWRDAVTKFVYGEDDKLLHEWNEEDGQALLVGNDDLSVLQKEDYMKSENGRRDRLLALATGEKGENGLDHLWERVCRKWLD